MHTRMTLVQLSQGGLWVHSPIALSEAVIAAVEALDAPVTAIIAPNKYHHLYVADWQRRYPQAHIFAEPKVQQKIPELAGAQTLTNTTPQLYREDVDQVLMAGNPQFQEFVFFHKLSRTLILTDLFINLKITKATWLARQFLRFEGVVAPDGGIPRLYRWLTLDKATAKDAAQKIIDWAPERVTFCHGEDFPQDAHNLLQRELHWLLK